MGKAALLSLCFLTFLLETSGAGMTIAMLAGVAEHEAKPPSTFDAMESAGLRFLAKEFPSLAHPHRSDAGNPSLYANFNDKSLEDAAALKQEKQQLEQQRRQQHQLQRKREWQQQQQREEQQQLEQQQEQQQLEQQRRQQQLQQQQKQQKHGRQSKKKTKKASKRLRHSVVKARYGPSSCVSLWKDSATNTCVMQTDCGVAIGVDDYDMGFQCESEGKPLTIHMYGKNSFAATETFDTGEECGQCNPLQDKKMDTTEAVADLAVDVKATKDHFDAVEASVEDLEKAAKEVGITF
eukprot:TRINITY_DN268_c1_g1_i1.p1 TRINITY_DN268_c1_g1~~TRINITY_DN268_c1_g1_i1.p1  ORF type:complete len:294 (-),score=98.41 TRINITY_DN268_c1_g1_i1:94-975(-)